MLAAQPGWFAVDSAQAASLLPELQAAPASPGGGSAARNAIHLLEGGSITDILVSRACPPSRPEPPAAAACASAPALTRGCCTLDQPAKDSAAAVAPLQAAPAAHQAALCGSSPGSPRSSCAVNSSSSSSILQAPGAPTRPGPPVVLLHASDLARLAARSQ